MSAHDTCSHNKEPIGVETLVPVIAIEDPDHEHCHGVVGDPMVSKEVT